MTKIRFSRDSMMQLFVVGLMLFALFFGAGNLIFPAQLGQQAGEHIFSSVFGFLVTGAGLPLLGIVAIGFSKEKSVRDLATRVHPIFGLLFALALYLTIGPFFALPRTATVAFEIGIVPLANVTDETRSMALLIFSIVFFTVSLWLSLSPSQLVDRIGKVLTPILLVAILTLVIYGLSHPMGDLKTAQAAYQNTPLVSGFIAGYNTMDALASLVFGIIVIEAINSNEKIKDNDISVQKVLISGLIAATALAIVYGFVAYLGATSVNILGYLDNGAEILTGIANHYFGTYGNLLMAIIVILACMTTSVGLICACSSFFHSLMPNVSYRLLVLIFSIFACAVANRGLNEIITYSIPVLMLLYPLTIVLIILSFLDPLFHGNRKPYFVTMLFTLPISFLDGYGSLFGLSDGVKSVLGKMLPFYEMGLGWIFPAAIGMFLGIALSRLAKNKT